MNGEKEGEGVAGLNGLTCFVEIACQGVVEIVEEIFLKIKPT